MSSWNNGRRHFRERSVKRIEPTTDPLPSRWIVPNYYAVICAIALNEEPYIDEWINYHRLLGFSHIYIYDNSDNNTLKDKESGFVTVIHFPGLVKQLQAYDLFVTTYKDKHSWGAFIDCDEFIVLKKHNSIIDFLKEYDDCDGIGLNWLMFGTSREKNYKNEPVLSRFRYCASTLDTHIKSIVKLKKIQLFLDPHMPLLKNGIICNTQRGVISGSYNDNLLSDVAYIHHYYTKSEEEFLKKINRGRADISEKRSLAEMEELHSNNNDVYNSDAWDFYSRYLHSSS
jgi:hypothetical protein